MARVIGFDAPTAPPDGGASKKPARLERTFNVEVITPVVGGGVEAGAFDPDFPVRGTSVRGNLRFWWRATRGAKYNTTEELYAAESEIWGSTEKASPTKIIIQLPDKAPEKISFGNIRNAYGFGDGRNSSAAYVLFPMIVRRDNIHQDLGKAGFSFKITFNFKLEYADDIACAFWAWINFGGIGSRTRRGCGALYCKDMAVYGSSVKSIKACFEYSAKSYGILKDTDRNTEWPILKNVLVRKTEASDALLAWQESAYVVKQLRQYIPKKDKNSQMHLGSSIATRPLVTIDDNNRKHFWSLFIFLPSYLKVFNEFKNVNRKQKAEMFIMEIKQNTYGYLEVL